MCLMPSENNNINSLLSVSASSSMQDGIHTAERVLQNSELYWASQPGITNADFQL